MLTGISLTLHDFGPDDVPDVTPHGLDEVIIWVERAFTALVQSCITAGDGENRMARNANLSVSAAGRAHAMAYRHGDAGLIGFARWC